MPLVRGIFLIHVKFFSRGDSKFIHSIIGARLRTKELWWNHTPTVLHPLQITYNSLARWITGLLSSTRVAKHLTCARLPPLDIYLDYLSNKYAIRLLFLPPDYALDFPPPDLNNPRPPYPISTNLFKNSH
jgi:hypothetical protein